MFGNKKVLKRLDEIEASLKRLINIVNADERLASQNKELMDRLMAKDWGDYQTYQITQPDITPVSYDPFTDETNAGEILSDEKPGQ
jgi:hypothetical protein